MNAVVRLTTFAGKKLRRLVRVASAETQWAVAVPLEGVPNDAVASSTPVFPLNPARELSPPLR